MTEIKHVAWAFFFGVFFSAIGVAILTIGGHRSSGEDRVLTILVGLIPLLLALRFFFAAFTGRIPPWMEELIDNPDD